MPKPVDNNFTAGFLRLLVLATMAQILDAQLSRTPTQSPTVSPTSRQTLIPPPNDDVFESDDGNNNPSWFAQTLGITTTVASFLLVVCVCGYCCSSRFSKLVNAAVKYTIGSMLEKCGITCCKGEEAAALTTGNFNSSTQQALPVISDAQIDVEEGQSPTVVSGEDVGSTGVDALASAMTLDHEESVSTPKSSF